MNGVNFHDEMVRRMMRKNENTEMSWSKLIDVNYNNHVTLCIKCLICDESIDLDEYEEEYVKYNKPLFKVCDKCKAAVMKIRNDME